MDKCHTLVSTFIFIGLCNSVFQTFQVINFLLLCDLGMHGREVIEQVERGYRMPKPTCHFIPDAIYRLMLQCWDADPDKRPTFEFLNHYLEDFTVTSELPYREVID